MGNAIPIRLAQGILVSSPSARAERCRPSSTDAGVHGSFTSTSAPGAVCRVERHTPLDSCKHMEAGGNDTNLKKIEIQLFPKRQHQRPKQRYGRRILEGDLADHATSSVILVESRRGGKSH